MKPGKPLCEVFAEEDLRHTDQLLAVELMKQEYRPAWKPTVSPEQAMTVLRELVDRIEKMEFGDVGIYRACSGLYHAETVCGAVTVRGTGDTLELAICNFAKEFIDQTKEP